MNDIYKYRMKCLCDKSRVRSAKKCANIYCSNMWNNIITDSAIICEFCPVHNSKENIDFFLCDPCKNRDYTITYTNNEVTLYHEGNLVKTYPYNDAYGVH